MRFVDFLSALADDIQHFEPEPIQPCDGSVYDALMEAQRVAQEAQQ